MVSLPIGSSSYWLKEVEKLNVLTVNHHMKSTLVSSVNKPQGKRMGFPNGSVAKNLPANAGDARLIPGLGRSPGGGNGNPLQYSCLKNPMDRGACWAAVHGVTKSRTRLGDFTFTFTFMHWRRKWQPLQCSCLENPRNGGAWWAAVYGVTQSQTRLK